MISNDLLKQRILDLAIHGELVDNDSSLQPVDVETIDGEVPFDIPSNWKWVELDNLVNYKNGYAFNSSMMSKNNIGIPVIKSANIGSKKVVIDSKTDYVENPTDKMLNCIVNKDDILMVLSSQSANVEPLGVSAIYKLSEPALLNQRVLKLICNENIIPDYLLYVINSHWFHDKLSNKAAGLAQANLKLSHVLTMEVPVPPIKEQSNIIQIIERTYTLIDQKEKNDQEKDKLKMLLKNKILDSAIRGELADNDLSLQPVDVEAIDGEVPFDIPSNWKWSTLGIATQINPRNQIDDSSIVGFIPMTNFSGGYISKYTYEQRKWKDVKTGFTHFKNDDVVIAKITPCFENRKSAYISGLPSGYGSGTTELHVLRNIDNKLFMPYLLWFVKGKHFIDEGVGHFTGTAGQQRVSKDWLSKIKVPLPPLEQQKKIVDKIEQCFELIEQL